ncbi:MAG: hypothetical protein FD174_694 [Geobacteraceae bacterium]|nr:MAG: hypothetical protein FD174_694 [Geobacteraceae bacterium]
MKKVMGKKSVVRIFVLLAVFLLGGVSGWFIGSAPERNEPEESKGYLIRQGGYRLINPLLECEIAEDTIRSRELSPFKAKTEKLIAAVKKDKRATSVSVYFRDLNSGATFNINANEGYSPASLSKLPVLIAYLRMAEKEPHILGKKIEFEGNDDWGEMQNIKPEKVIEKGKSYAIEDLLYRMMAYSDNNAWGLLFNRVGVDYLDKILADLGVDYDKAKEEDFVTVKSYARFLRILYNASYLSKEMSEKALQYLTVVDFTKGLVAGVPKDVMVASKFGERTLGPNREIKQLHDFGIIYYPNRPYLLCLMTRGDDFEKLAGVIRDVSRLVYEEIDRQVKSH